MINIRFKKLSDKAVTPRYAKADDAAVDFTATSKTENDMYVEYGTDIALEIPLGHVGRMSPRSSICNYHLMLSNSVGTIDAGFRGEIRFRFKKTSDHWNAKYYEVGDRIGQLIVQEAPLMVFEEVAELSETERGLGGFGSSGK